MDLFDGDEGDERNLNQSLAELLSQRPAAADVICFHKGTEEILLQHVENTATKGDIDGILKSIDNFCYSRHWMMHLGDQKSQYLVSAIAAAKQRFQDSLICLELGSYCGYSTVLTASQLRSSSSKLISIEYNPNCCVWTNRLVSYANLSDKVHVIEGSLESTATQNYLKSTLESLGAKVGLVFIDHDKKRYLTELQTLESLNVLRSGCVVVADNIMCFGEPSREYLSQVRDPNGPFESSVFHECYIEYTMPPTDDPNFSESDAISKAKLSHPVVSSLRDGIEVSIYR